MRASVEEAKAFICQNKKDIWHPIPEMVKEYLNISSRANKLAVLRITGFFYFVHRPVFYKVEHTTFWKLDLFPSSGEGGSTYSVGSFRKS
jgi:hypothetical protein